jgi:Leucine-rich repeat (LRR) protein
MKSLRLILKNNSSLDELIQNIDIVELELVSKVLTKIPKNLHRFKKIEKLSFYFDSLEQFPEEIFELTALTQLKMIRGKVSQLPEKSWNRLKLLKKLFVTDQLIEFLPTSLFELSQLEELNLSSNKIVQLSKEFKSLGGLKRLNLNGNPLEDFPFLKNDFPQLHSLSLDNCQFREEKKIEISKEFNIWFD